MDGEESKKYPLPPNWALSNQLDSLNRDWQEYIYIATVSAPSCQPQRIKQFKKQETTVSNLNWTQIELC